LFSLPSKHFSKNFTLSHVLRLLSSGETVSVGQRRNLTESAALGRRSHAFRIAAPPFQSR
jgi:hypothetical protein